MASLLELPATALQVLNAFAGQLAVQGVEVPERQYVTPGSMIVWDGAQLTVSLMGIAQGQPGVEFGQTYVPHALIVYAQFAVNLVREITVINTEGFVEMDVPTPAQMGADGAVLLADASALVVAAETLRNAFVLTGPGEGFVLSGLQPVGPGGGLAGSRMLISLSLT